MSVTVIRSDGSIRSRWWEEEEEEEEEAEAEAAAAPGLSIHN